MSASFQERVDLSELPALPNGWVWGVPIDFCAAVASGSTPTAEKMTEGKGDVPFIKVYNLTHVGTLDFSVRPTFINKATHKGRQQRSVTLPGDVLINIVGPPLGKVSVVPDTFPEWNINQAIVLFRPKTGVSNRYLCYALLTDSVMKRVTRLAKATVGQFNIGVNMCRHLLPVPIAPTNEQQRIVDELEELLSDLDAGVEALKRVQVKLGHYRAAVLKAAVEGALTAGWREQHPDTEPASELLKRILSERRRRWEEDQRARFEAAGKQPPNGWQSKYKEPAAPDTTNLPTLPPGWCWTTVEQCAALIQYGSSEKTLEEATGIPVLRMGNIRTDGSLDLTDLKYLPPQHPEFPDLLLKAGDLLFNRTNSAELVGKTGIYRGVPSPASFASYLIRVRMLPEVEPILVAACINGGMGRQWIREVVNQTVGQANVNGTKLAAFAFPLPPSKEQPWVIESIEDQLSVIEHTEADLEARLRSSQALRQSILRHAFTGQLVPQDPNDEPASELLKRIATERESRAEVETKKPRSRARAATKA